jgi:hypothetical protein
MDTAALVNRIKEMFLIEKINGLYVDSFGLAPAYKGFATNSYVLGVSAPSLRGTDCYEKMRIVIQAMFAHLTENERRFINRVRVYDSKSDLERHKENDFDEFDCDVCESATSKSEAELFEMAF